MLLDALTLPGPRPRNDLRRGLEYSRLPCVAGCSKIGPFVTRTFCCSVPVVSNKSHAVFSRGLPAIITQ